MASDPTSTDQLDALKKELVALHVKARKTTSWANLNARTEISRVRGEMAKLLWPTLTAMDGPELWEHLHEARRDVVRALQMIMHAQYLAKSRTLERERGRGGGSDPGTLRKYEEIPAAVELAISELKELDTILKYIQQLRASYILRQRSNDVAKQGTWRAFSTIIGCVGEEAGQAFYLKMPPYRVAPDWRYDSLCAAVPKTLELLEKRNSDFMDQDVAELYSLARYEFLELECNILKED